MSYYKRLLTEISVPETAVDCASCTDLYKCCTYRPFIANFLAGEMSEVLLQVDLKEWDLTICGLSPAMTYRKQFKSKGGWGFGTDATLLCTFYDKSFGGCKVWESRPSVCRTFFCKSTYEQGQDYWKGAEELTWQLEWALLEDFLYHEGWTITEVEEVKAYLHEDAIDRKTKCPAGTVFESVATAIEFYKKATKHVASLEDDVIIELLGKKGGERREQVLALKRNLR